MSNKTYIKESDGTWSIIEYLPNGDYIYIATGFATEQEAIDAL